jgi:hypothetical protein
MAENSKYLLNKFDEWDLNDKTMIDSYCQASESRQMCPEIRAIAKLDNETSDAPLAPYELKTRLTNNISRLSKSK